MRDSRNSSPIITIELLTDPDILHPYYRQFGGLPKNLSPSGFYELIASASSFMRFYTAYYNGELVAVFECRPIKGEEGVWQETHTVWFTDVKRKRAITLDRFLDHMKDNHLITFVRPDESDGHFAFARRGKMHYMGEHQNLHVFRS